MAYRDARGLTHRCAGLAGRPPRGNRFHIQAVAPETGGARRSGRPARRAACAPRSADGWPATCRSDRRCRTPPRPVARGLAVPRRQPLQRRHLLPAGGEAPPASARNSRQREPHDDQRGEEVEQRLHHRDGDEVAESHRRVVIPVPAHPSTSEPMMRAREESRKVFNTPWIRVGDHIAVGDMGSRGRTASTWSRSMLPVVGAHRHERAVAAHASSEGVHFRRVVCGHLRACRYQ